MMAPCSVCAGVRLEGPCECSAKRFHEKWVETIEQLSVALRKRDELSAELVEVKRVAVSRHFELTNALESIAQLESALRSARGAAPIMWTCDTCGFSCDIATEPLGIGDECMACENKAFRARLGIES